MKKSFLYSATILALLGTGTPLMSGVIHADEAQSTQVVDGSNSSSQSSDKTQEQKNQNADAIQKKALSKTYVSIGSGVRDVQSVKQALGAKDDDTVFTTNGNQLDQYLQLPGIPDQQVQSSVRISPAEPGTGTKVNIVDYQGQNNITTITSQQYAMAATVAGINDVIITVTSPQKVDGSGALAGVYQALAKNGTDLDTRNTSAANQLLDSTKDAIDQNKGDSSYPGKLTSAVVQTAGDVAKDQQQGKDPDIKGTLNKNLDKTGVADKTSEAQRQPIINAIQVVNQAPVSKTSEFTKNADKAGDMLNKAKGEIMAQAGDFDGAGFIDKIKGFFGGLMNSLSNLKNDVIGPKQEKSNDSSQQSQSTSSKDDSHPSRSTVREDANNVDSDGTANSSRLLQLFNKWNGTKEGSIIPVNGDKSQFSDDEKHEKFLTHNNATALNPMNGLQMSALDSLGRAQVGNAYVTQQTMSGHEKRIPIPVQSTPSGWYKNATFSQKLNQWVGPNGKTQAGLKSNNIKMAKGGMLYNRSHIIGAQLIDDTNKKTNGNGNHDQIMSVNNLITGTRVQNADKGMLLFENKIAKAVNAGAEVRYQVTPIYDGTELVPRMTHVQAYSTSDNGKSVDFNDVVLNVEPGYKIDYKTGAAEAK